MTHWAQQQPGSTAAWWLVYIISIRRTNWSPSLETLWTKNRGFYLQNTHFHSFKFEMFVDDKSYVVQQFVIRHHIDNYPKHCIRSCSPLNLDQIWGQFQFYFIRLEYLFISLFSINKGSLDKKVLSVELGTRITMPQENTSLLIFVTGFVWGLWVNK